MSDKVLLAAHVDSEFHKHCRLAAASQEIPIAEWLRRAAERQLKKDALFLPTIAQYFDRKRSY